MPWEQASSAQDRLCQREGEGSGLGPFCQGVKKRRPGTPVLAGGGGRWAQMHGQRSCRRAARKLESMVSDTPGTFPEGRGTQSPGRPWQCRGRCGEGPWKGEWEALMDGAEGRQRRVQERRLCEMLSDDRRQKQDGSGRVSRLRESPFWKGDVGGGQGALRMRPGSRWAEPTSGHLEGLTRGLSALGPNL